MECAKYPTCTILKYLSLYVIKGKQCVSFLVSSLGNFNECILPIPAIIFGDLFYVVLKKRKKKGSTIVQIKTEENQFMLRRWISAVKSLQFVQKGSLNRRSSRWLFPFQRCYQKAKSQLIQQPFSKHNLLPAHLRYIWYAKIVFRALLVNYLSFYK